MSGPLGASQFMYSSAAAGAGITLTTTASATDLVPYVVVASNRVLLGTPQLAFS